VKVLAEIDTLNNPRIRVRTIKKNSIYGLVNLQGGGIHVGTIDGVVPDIPP
jgi:hypothetical protein